MTEPQSDEPNGERSVPQGASTLLETLNNVKEAGFPGQFIAQDDGNIRCTACGRTQAATDTELEGFVRIEGASDAADLNLVGWFTCPSCWAGGALTLGYGPNASAADVAVMACIDIDEAPRPGSVPNA